MHRTRTYLRHIVSGFTWHYGNELLTNGVPNEVLSTFRENILEFWAVQIDQRYRPENGSHVLVEPFFRLLVWAVWPRLKTELVSVRPQADGGTGQSDRGSTQENEAVRDRNPCRHAQSNRVNVPGLDCRLFERKRVLFRANIGSQAHN